MANKQIEDMKNESQGNFEFDDDKSFSYSKVAARKSKPWFERFLDSVIPVKEDTKPELIRKIVLLVSVVVFVACIVIIINQDMEHKQRAKADQQIIEVKENVVLTGVIPLEEQKIEEIKKEVPGILDEYVALYDLNPDVIGWVKIDGTPIDYPVMQTGDNDFYLYKDFNKNYSIFGTIFADYHVPITAEARPNNTVLYGHNIEDGSYFAKLTRYFPQVHGMGFYRAHPTVTFDTIYEEGTYKIFAGIYQNTQEKHGKVYDYYRKRYFKDKESFYDYVGNILDRSTFYTDVDLEYGDEILTLSTCFYPLGEAVDTRFVVLARRVREGENPDVDVDKAYMNDSPLYFDYYYKVNGGSWKGRTWDTSKVKGFDEFVRDNPDAAIAKVQ